jgi:hypothetical protein
MPKWYQSEYKIDFCREKGILVSDRGIKSVSTMPPRRHVEPPVTNKAMERDMRELCARMDAMEIAQRRAPDAGDISEAENEEVEVK